MTKTVMVGLAGGFPLVNADSNLRIEPGPATEVELTPWVVTQLAAGSLIKFDPEADAAAEAAAFTGKAKR